MTDPRVDAETAAYWNDLIDQIRERLDDLFAGQEQDHRPAYAALRAVLDLHVPWEFREQQFADPTAGPMTGAGASGGRLDDVVLGLGCRFCGGIRTSPERTALHYRPCRTIQEIEAHILGHPTTFDIASRWTHRDHPQAIFEYVGANNPYGAHEFTLVEGADGEHTTAIFLTDPIALRGLSPLPAT